MKITNLFSCLIFLCILCFSSTLKSQCNTVAIDGQNIGASTAGNPIDVCAGATVDVTGTVTGGLLDIQFYQGANLIQTSSFSSLPGTLVVPATGTYQLFSNMGTTTCSTGHLAASGGPSNNLIVGALDIDCLSGPYTGTTTCATDADYPGQCSTSTNAAPGVWYKIQGIDADITLDLCTSTNYDTQMSVWSGSPSSLTCEGGNDDICGLGSQVTFSSVVGTTYYVYVFGHTNNPTGDFTLTVTCDCTTTVLNINDAGHGSLRDAVACAISGDVITFDPSINTQLIQLTSGQISINKDLTIEGNGVDNTIIDGALDNSSRLLLVNSGSTVHFENITFQNGGSASYADSGAGLTTFGNTSILDCNFSNNNNLNFTGSAIRQDNGDLKVVNCKFENNGITGSGSFESVIWIQNLSSTAYISQCIFSGNDVSTLIVENSSSFDFRNNTVDGNALSTRILQVSSAAINVHNNILNDNIDPIVKFQSGTISATNNISFLSDVTLLPTADGNIVGDALLNANQTLISTSPAIAAGNNNEISEDILDVDGDGVTMEDLPSDFDGNIRIEGCTSNIDIGAFETDDSGTGVVSNTRDDGYGSLRYEVACAASGSTITFDPSINTQLIQLTSGQITINKDLNIEGNGVANTIIDGALDNNSRLFRVDAGHTVHFEGMTFQNGGSATYNSFGAGIFTRGNTSILGCKFSGNNNMNGGCAIMQDAGDLKIVNCEFSDNGLLSSGNFESIIWKQGSAEEIEIYQSTFFGNDVARVITILDGTANNISQNTFANNTVSSRVMSFQSTGTNTFSNNVVEETEAPLLLSSGATATVNNNISLVAHSNLPVSQGNIVGSALLNTDYTLMATSPAIAAGDNAFTPADILDVDNDGNTTEDLPQDYAGGARIQGCSSNVDIGAYEANDSGTGIVTNTRDGGYGSLRYEVECAASGSTITFDPSINTQLIQLTSGQITINKDLTIEGNGVANTIIDGALDDNSRLFRVDAGHTVHFEGMTFLNGGSATYSGSGAALRSLGVVSILNCQFSGNNNTQFGNTIMQLSGDLKVVNCEFSQNGLLGAGGNESVIWKQGTNSTAQINQCPFWGNDVFNEVVSLDGVSFDFSQNSISNTNNQRLIVLQGVGANTIHNNILNSTGDIMALAGGATATTSNNLLEHTDSALPSADGNFVGDPLFTDASTGDLSLMSGSPAISAADDTTLPLDILDVDGDSDVTEVLPLDYNGDTRTHACLLDIGAIEYQGNDMAIIVTNTNDSGPGSFRAALACAPDGSTITFNAATDGTPIMLLTGNLFPTNNNITIKGNGLGNTILDGDLMNDRLFDLDGKTMHVEDLTMQKFYKTGSGESMISDLSNGAYIEIQNCLIDESGSGDFPSLIMARGSTFVLENSRVTNCTGEVLIIAQINSPNNIIKQCLFDNNTVTGFEAFGNKDSGTTTDFIQNTFTNNTCTSTTPDPVIQAESSAGVTISNNIIYNNTGFGQALFLASGSVLNAATSNIVDTPGDLPAGSYIIDNPLFVDLAADNYKLQACSPAIGRGDAGVAPSEDTEGHIRPTGFGVDIGWDEYTGAACPEGQCSMAIDINCGETYTDDNYDGANTIDTYNYNGTNHIGLTGPEKIYKITTTEMGLIRVTSTREPGVLGMFLVTDCTDGTTVVGQPASTATNLFATYNNAPAGDYYIIFDGISGGTTDFTFDVDATCGHVPCTENIVMINAPDDPMGLYHAIDEIQSDATINNDATYKAGNHIDLNEGFEVTAGQVFEAIIEPCPN